MYCFVGWLEWYLECEWDVECLVEEECVFVVQVVVVYFVYVFDYCLCYCCWIIYYDLVVLCYFFVQCQLQEVVDLFEVGG